MSPFAGEFSAPQSPALGHERLSPAHTRASSLAWKDGGEDVDRIVGLTVYPGWCQGPATHIHVEVTRNGAA